MFESLTGAKSAVIGNPSQQFLKLSEVRDNTIVMKDGTLRAVLAVSSTNFDLKSQDEQNALIYNYQRFINSLEFPVQILMQSRKIDVGEYIESIKVLMEHQTNELLRMQTGEYIDFINRLIESANIMNKNFYVIVPLAQSIEPAAGGLFSKLFGGGQVKQVAARTQNFENYHKMLEDRVSSISSNLASIGLRVVRLNTEQLIELMYNSYNFAAGPLIDAGQLENVTLMEEPKG